MYFSRQFSRDNDKWSESMLALSLTLKTTLPLMQGANINYYSNYCRIKTYEIYNIYSKKMKIQSILLKVNARKVINTASFILHLQMQK